MDREDGALKAIRKVIASRSRQYEQVDLRDRIRGAAPFFPENLQDQCDILDLGKEEVLFGKCSKEEPCFFRLLQGDVSVQQEILGEVVTHQRAFSGDWLLKPLKLAADLDAAARRFRV